jgi:phosphoheptose isomerase
MALDSDPDTAGAPPPPPVRVRAAFAQAAALNAACADALAAPIAQAAARIRACCAAGGKVLACGNGGSASDALHFAAELVGRFERERPGLPALALAADSAVLTALGNDYGYDQVYARQVHALGRPGDLLLAISTSGSSRNVLAAVGAAHAAKLGIIALTGRDGGALARALRAQDLELRVAHPHTARVQEVHILILHCICMLLDAPEGAA